MFAQLQLRLAEPRLPEFCSQTRKSDNLDCRLPLDLQEDKAKFAGTIAAEQWLMVKSEVRSFRDLDVWRLSMDLVDSVFLETKQMPRDEFDLRRQIRRAAVSIPANIAEGYRRKKKTAAYQNHVSIALGSQGELETELEIAKRNAFMSDDRCRQLSNLCDRVGAMLYRLHESLDS